MTSRLIALIDSNIPIDWSPEQVSWWLREEHNILISHETIYLNIWADKKQGGQLFQHLRRKGKAYQSRSKDKQVGRGFIKNRVSIDERPPVVENKNRIGDWEIDLVIGKGHSGALVTIVERKARFTVAMLVDDKSARSVKTATIALLQPFEGAVLTITADNGKEFAIPWSNDWAFNVWCLFCRSLLFMATRTERKYEWTFTTILAQINKL